MNHETPGAAEPQSKADPIGHKDRKKGLGFGRNRPRAYRRDAVHSIYLGFFVLFVAINSSRPASIFEDSQTKKAKADWGMVARVPSEATSAIGANAGLAKISVN